MRPVEELDETATATATAAAAASTSASAAGSSGDDDDDDDGNKVVLTGSWVKHQITRQTTCHHLSPLTAAELLCCTLHPTMDSYLLLPLLARRQSWQSQYNVIHRNHKPTNKRTP